MATAPPSLKHPTQDAIVRSHIHSLLEAAEAERIAAAHRRVDREEHLSHPTLDHAHARGGLRRAVGHALIGLGAAIAGSSAEPDAGRVV